LVLDESIFNDQGEMAIKIVQDESGNYGIAGYMTPNSGAEEFSKKELRDLYLLHRIRKGALVSL
jgi:hypothetical protein